MRRTRYIISSVFIIFDYSNLCAIVTCSLFRSSHTYKSGNTSRFAISLHCRHHWPEMTPLCGLDPLWSNGVMHPLSRSQNLGKLFLLNRHIKKAIVCHLSFSSQAADTSPVFASLAFRITFFSLSFSSFHSAHFFVSYLYS